MAYVFKKENAEPILIENVEDEHEEQWDFVPSFWWNNKRYHIEEDFKEICQGHWTDVPGNNAGDINITHIERDVFRDPMFLEFPDERHVNIYKEVERGEK